MGEELGYALFRGFPGGEGWCSLPPGGMGGMTMTRDPDDPASAAGRTGAGSRLGPCRLEQWRVDQVESA